MAEGNTSGQHLHELPKSSIELSSIELDKFISFNSSASEVWSAFYTGKRGQRRQVAAKKVPPGGKSDNKEAHVLHLINHKNVIKFYGIWKQTEQDVYIIMEHASRGNLRNFLDKCKEDQQRLPTELMWKWIYEAACALHHLETIKHSHRNIMSQHFLITEDYTLKLGEFGLAIRLDNTQNTNTGLGACKWMAPEVIKKQLRSPKSDIFSYGIVVWEIFTLGIPFDHVEDNDRNHFKVMNAVCEGVRPPIPDDCPDYLKNLMTTCWDEDRDKRPNIKAVCFELEPYLGDVSEVTVPKDNAASEAKGISPLEKVLTDQMLMGQLANDLSSEWQELATFLIIPATEIDQIKIDNTGNIKLTIFKMLIKWRQRQNPETGLQSALDTLSEALSTCKREDLASKVRSLNKYTSV